MGAGGSKPFVVVTGSGRSGTTLLRFMLDSHPDMAVTDEFSFIVFARYAHLPVEGPFDWRRAMDALDTVGYFWLRWELDHDAARATVAHDQPTTLGEFERSLAGLYARERGKARAGVKCPNYATAVDILGRLHPDARFVHLLRDGRDVISSFCRAPFGPTSAIEATLLWKDRVQAARAAGKTLGAQRYLEIDYADLVGDQERTVRSVCEFIELDYTPEMLDHRQNAQEYATRGGHENLARPLQAPSSNWNDRLSRDEVVAVELLAGDLLDELGYERSGYRPTRQERVTVPLRAVAERTKSRADTTKRAVRRAVARQVKGAPGTRQRTATRR